MTKILNFGGTKIKFKNLISKANEVKAYRNGSYIVNGVEFKILEEAFMFFEIQVSVFFEGCGSMKSHFRRKSLCIEFLDKKGNEIASYETHSIKQSKKFSLADLVP